MLTGLKKILFQPSTNWKFWLLIALFIRGAFFFLQIHIFHSKTYWGITEDDTFTYLSPIESLIDKGKYDPDFRMPGYGIIYLPLYFLFSRIAAYNILLLIQLLLSAISVYVLAITTEKLFKQPFFFYAVFYLYALSYNVCTYDSTVLTESFTTSFLIILVFFFIRYFENRNSTAYLVISGVLLTWVIFLRPVFVPIMFLFLLLLFFLNVGTKKQILIACITFISPFILIDGAWIVRNYIHYKKIIPLTNGLYLPGYDNGYFQAANEFVESWGGGYARDYNGLNNMPSYIYTSKFNADSLKKLNDLTIAFDTTNLTAAEKSRYLNLIRKKFNVYAQSVKEEKPFLYYVKAPISNIRTFIGMSTMLNLLFFIKTYGYPFSIVISWIYYIVVISSFFGILLLLKQSSKKPILLIIYGIPLYIVFIHCVVLRLPHNRYLVPVYPFLLICSLNIFYFCYIKLRNSLH